MLATRGAYCDVQPFQIEDYVAVHEVLYAQAPWRPDAEQSGRAYFESGPAFTARWQGRILACAGLVIPWPGLGCAWAVITPEGRRHPVMIHRTVGRYLAELIAARQLRRVEATAMSGHEQATRWLERLGFEFESRKPAWGPEGQAGMVYAMVASRG